MRIALCLLLLLAGCEKHGRETVRVSIYPGLMESFPLHLAQQLGHFEREGIEVEFQGISGGTKKSEALLAGSTDVSYDGYGYTFMVPPGRKVKSFAVTSLRPLTVLAVSPANSSRIQRVADLRGSVVGVGSFGGFHEWTLGHLLSRHGLPLASVKLIAVGAGPTGIAALEHGKVDAAIVNASVLSILTRRAPHIRVLIDVSTPEGCRDAFGADVLPAFSLLATSDWLAHHPNSARKLAAALLQTLRWIREHSPEEIRGKLPDELRTTDVELDLANIRLVASALSTDGRMPSGGPEIMQKVLSSSSNKIREANIDLPQTWTNEFVEAK